MNFEQWRQWWTGRAPEYFTDKVWHFSHLDLIKRLEIERHHCVLEIGFGYGREISQFCGLSDNVYGLELSPWSCENTLRELEERGVTPLPHLAAYDGQVLPFPAEAFHVIYSCFVIQHLSRAHARDLIKETLRILKADGKVLFEFFGDPAYYVGHRDVFSGDENDGGMFNNAYIEPEIPGLIAACGGQLLWQECRKITSTWGNYWVCFGRAG